MASARKRAEESWKSSHPATSREGRQARLENLALDLIEQRMLDGSASSQETTLFARSASTRGKLEEQRIYYENELLQAKKKQIESAEELQNMFKEAIEAMGGYRFEGDRDDPPNLHSVG
jgi:hypothetical protein